MLSKRAARNFFLGGTLVCLLAFVLLTIDTVKRVPAQTHSDKITPAVKRGKDLWDKHNCMGCHTILGEGAYYAPELTRVIERRGSAFVSAMLKNPESVYPGQRKMQNYHLSDTEIADLVAFLDWIGGMDLNGFPPKPTLGLAASASAQSNQASRPAVFNQICTACHALGGSGGAIGPALDGVGKKYDKTYLTKWLSDPQAVKPGTTMPKLPLAATDIEQLATFLAAQ